jgi:hypothetical protein
MRKYCTVQENAAVTLGLPVGTKLYARSPDGGLAEVTLGMPPHHGASAHAHAHAYAYAHAMPAPSPSTSLLSSGASPTPLLLQAINSQQVSGRGAPIY